METTSASSTSLRTTALTSSATSSTRKPSSRIDAAPNVLATPAHVGPSSRSSPTIMSRRSPSSTSGASTRGSCGAAWCRSSRTSRTVARWQAPRTSWIAASAERSELGTRRRASARQPIAQAGQELGEVRREVSELARQLVGGQRRGVPAHRIGERLDRVLMLRRRPRVEHHGPVPVSAERELTGQPGLPDPRLSRDADRRGLPAVRGSAGARRARPAPSLRPTNGVPAPTSSAASSGTAWTSGGSRDHSTSTAGTARGMPFSSKTPTSRNSSGASPTTSTSTDVARICSDRALAHRRAAVFTAGPNQSSSSAK